MAEREFEDYPQDVMKELVRLADSLYDFSRRYDWVSREAQDDPKATYLKLARDWDGLDLIETQRRIVSARHAIQILTGE